MGQEPTGPVYGSKLQSSPFAYEAALDGRTILDVLQESYHVARPCCARCDFFAVLNDILSSLNQFLSL
jgi:hypothetical protein